jgi:Na+-transporting NADH:ubiquinone oxidoreductase subunit NqrF
MTTPAAAAAATDPATGETVHGLCSNYLCDRKPGDELVMTGPAGTALLLNDDPWKKRIVCVSTGELACRKMASWLAGKRLQRLAVLNICRTA